MNSDSDTSVEQLKALARKFSDERDWDKFHNAKDLAIGIVTEGAELLEHFRFKSEKEVDSLFKGKSNRERIDDEVADALYFILRLAQRYDIDLTKALRKKIKKNEHNYPVSRAKGSNRKYTEFRV